MQMLAVYVLVNTRGLLHNTTSNFASSTSTNLQDVIHIIRLAKLSWTVVKAL